MAQISPVDLWKELYEFLFGFFRCVAVNQSKPMRQSENMRINNEPFISTEPITQNNVCCLASHAGKRHERFHRIGNMAAELFNNFPASTLNVFCLVMKKAGRSDGLFQLFQRGGSKILCGTELPEQ